MTTREKRIEAMARALCQRMGRAWGALDMRARDELIARATACDDALLAMGAIADHSPDAGNMVGMARDEQDEITARFCDPLPPIDPDTSRRTDTMSDIVEKLRFHGRFAAEDNDEMKKRKLKEREEAADEILRLRAACDAAFMAMCDYRDNGDAELFQDAIDALGIAALIKTP
jgi:hypothetical protein